ncbi:MAG: helix-turn-helix domain-containing protein [Pseudomonadota bacterium]
MITTRFRERLPLAELAAGVGLSPFHLHRMFKADTGQTPADYIERARLEYASHLMVVVPDAPLMQIAIESGFVSAATFARAFRKRFGETASEYRRRKRLDVNTSGPAPALPLRRLPARTLRVEPCELEESALSAGYARLLARCPDAWRTQAGIAVLGIFVDAPFHRDHTICRHYLAFEEDIRPEGPDTFRLPGGLHASIAVSGDLDAMSREIVRFKTERLDPSPYAIASTLAYERIVLPSDARTFDYRDCAREVFVKVRRRHEPAF